MKEATGELNMTVVTVVAIAAIAAFFYTFVWPGIKDSIKKNTCEAQCSTGDSSCVNTCMNKDNTNTNTNTNSNSKSNANTNTNTTHCTLKKCVCF